MRPQTGAQPLAIFTITLGTAYYDQGLVNPGVDASRLLGADGEPVEVMFDDGTDPVVSVINRRANPNGTVRIVGHNRQIADWFRRHFQRGDLVKAQVLGANHILLMAPKVNIRNAERS